MSTVNLNPLTLGRMQNPVRGFLHGTAAVAAVVGTVVLFLRASSWLGRAALVVFGLGLAALFTTSALYHSIPWRRVWKVRMQRLDHSMIFVLIAASYTPFAVTIVGGRLGWWTLAIGWSIALSGIGMNVFFPTHNRKLGIALMTTFGWLSLPIMIPIGRTIGIAPVLLLAAGGVLYTVGMVFLAIERPRLWPRVFSYHEAFHLLVVIASGLHFTAVYRYVAPLPA